MEDAVGWCWILNSSNLFPVVTNLEATPQYILKMIRCLHIVDCSTG